MKHKLYYLLGVIGTCGLLPKSGFAALSNFQTKDTVTNVADTIGQGAKFSIRVKDRRTSKLLDSVRVTLGREAKFTANGLAEFDLTKDSIAFLVKPGYNRVVKKLTSSAETLYMLKSDEVLGSFAVLPDARPIDGRLSSGTAIQISGDDLRNVSRLSLLEGLRFYVPSLQVSQNYAEGSNPNILPEISFRGSSSFPVSPAILSTNSSSGLQVNPSAGDYRAYNTSLPNTPVILLDGIQVSLQTVQDIDLNRIKNVSIFRDAVSTASFGMQGGSSIIALQTTRPESKFQVSFSEQLSIAQADLSSFQRLTAKQKLDIDKASGLFDGDLSSLYQNRYTQAYDKGTNTDWLSVPLRHSISAKHSLNLSAGNEDVVYGVNASYNDIQGVMKGSYRKNLDLGAYFGGRIGTVSFNNQFSYLGVDAANSPYGTFDQYLLMNPYWEAVDPYTGKYQKIVEQYTLNGKEVTFKNPAFNSTLSTTDQSQYTRFTDLMNLSWTIGAGFQLNGMASINRQGDEKNHFLPPNHTAFADVSSDNLFKRGLYSYVSNSFTDVQGGVRLQYENTFGPHHLSANVGQRISQTSSESEGVEVGGFAVDRLADISFGNAYTISKPISGKIKSRYAASFANAQYDYADRYLVDVSGSLDYYSGISKEAVYMGLGLGWNIHREEFLKTQEWINTLKIRASIGTSGNQGFLTYLNRTTYDYYTDKQYIPTGSGTGTIGIGLGAYLTGKGNPDLKAPKTFKQDVSLEAQFFNKRLSFAATLYKQVTKDMILPLEAMQYTGFQNFSYSINAGEIENTGLELGLSARLIDRVQSNFKLDLITNAFHGTNKITQSASYLTQFNQMNNSAVEQVNPTPQYVVGYSPYAIWAVPSLGIDAQTGNEIFLKKDGSKTTVWDSNDKVFAGNMTPTWNGGMGLDLSYGRFSFVTFWQATLGAKIYNTTRATIENAGINDNLDGRALTDARWVMGKADAVYKALYHSPTYATTRLVETNNTLRCSTISLGYLLPQQLAEKCKAKNIGVKLMLNNAFELGGADMQVGLRYPLQRNYSFILNATF